MVRVGKAQSLAAAQKAFNDHEKRRRRTAKRLRWQLFGAAALFVGSQLAMIWIFVRYAA